MDTEPTPESPHSRLRSHLRDRAAGSLSFAVIVWSDDPEAQPTVIADRSPVVVARATVLATHEMITDPYLYAGATDFVETQNPHRTGEPRRMSTRGSMRCSNRRRTRRSHSTASR
ncbi:hypothetical protein [Microbacterium marinilacus]|uniref:Uncharacterized protein n=1 Tax=Microbacterium marinilacus TaxID=415209 RepID=A0ABP7BND8_9MICO|nr:hypothetical protein [Microbacterium marinilacus]MBY0688828.1 hypothetical protein [Microbacterium marinilacus]